jgi:hypothetical protein
MNTTKVKVIKLNGRYKLYKEHGFAHAIRFSSWSSEAGRVESFLRERYGSEYPWNHKTYMWRTHWGKVQGNNPRPYFIGVRDEEMIFIAKLAGVIQ